MNKHAAKLAAIAGALVLGACAEITVPDYLNPPLEDLLANPSVGEVLQTATGVMQGSRQDADSYVRFTAIPGREGYFLDANEARYVTRIYNGTTIQASNFTGSSYWTTPYRNIRTANILIAALGKVEMPAADEAAIAGFAKTIQAVDYLQLLNTREKIPVFVNTPLDSLFFPAPLVERAVAFAFISELLDQGLVDLQKGGPAFPFAMPTGFTAFAFNTPAKFVQLNRALKARVEVYRATLTTTPSAAGYQAALTALNSSFIEATGTADPLGDRALLNKGAYQTYSGNSGDVPNSLSDPSGKTVADSTLRSAAQRRPNGDPDARLVVKTETAPTVTVSGLSSNLRFTLYTSRPFFGAGGLNSPIPIIRNEELILLRAEARWFTGDRPGALNDLNFIRVNSGGLAPLTAAPATDAEFITVLLRERRFSLMFEGGHRWIDNRRFGRLTTLPRESTARVISNANNFGTAVPWFPLPANEANARK
ncbi:MAG TPA: RagB/SusD family nutrient uptake outer membrane protein [Longimicrobium sp.]|nr:RagB/SusD family nutrient uptake outer membrane protein [Longimicrobium sp.]